MWLVLCQDADAEAAWIADGLAARVDHPVVVVTANTLVHATRWEHRVGDGAASFRLVLGDGTVVDDESVQGVLNRLYWLSADGFAGASPRDREYANSELYALGLSWLESMGGRVLNRPRSGGIAGVWRMPAQWRAMARSAGLPVVPFSSDESVDGPTFDHARDRRHDRVVLVIDGVVLEAPEPARPELAPPIRRGLRDLQEESGHDMIEVRFTEGEGRAFRDVSFLPGLSRIGEPALDAVHRALLRRQGR
jgi:hypothetical protein